MRILHLSDLRIGLANDWSGRLSRELADADPQLQVPFDYLVVCGNLTQAGTPAQFQQVRRRLAELAGWLNLKGGAAADRVIVVPGESDLPGGNRDPFCQFYREHFGKDWKGLTGSVPYIIRQWRDLTAVGVCWPDAKGDGRALWAALAEELAGNRFACHRPLLLVSSGTPFHQDTNPTQGAVRPLVMVSAGVTRTADGRDSAGAAHCPRVTLQLTGAVRADTAREIFLPSGWRGILHPILSTGPHDSVQGPFHLNVVEIEPDAHNRQPHRSRHYLTIHPLELPRDDPPRLNKLPGGIEAGELDALFAPQARPLPGLSQQLLRAVERTIRGPGSKGTVSLVLVHGFPGSGKGRLYEALIRTGDPPAAGIPLEFARLNDDSYTEVRNGLAVEEAFASVFSQLRDLADGLADNAGARGLLVLCGSFSTHSLLPGEKKAEVERDLLKSILRWIDLPENKGGQRVTVIFIANHLCLGKARFVSYLESEGMGYAEANVEEHRLQGLDEEAWSSLLDLYARHVPIDGEDLARLTGRYLSLSELALDQALMNYSRSLAYNVEEGASRRLLATAPGVEEIRKKIERFKDEFLSAVKDVSVEDPNKVYEFICGALLRDWPNLAQGELPPSGRPDILLKAADYRTDLKGSDALELLTSYSICKPVEGPVEGPQDYRLVVPLPFVPRM